MQLTVGPGYDTSSSMVPTGVFSSVPGSTYSLSIRGITPNTANCWAPSSNGATKTPAQWLADGTTGAEFKVEWLHRQVTRMMASEVASTVWVYLPLAPARSLLWKETPLDDPALLVSVSRIAATGYGMFGFYDEEDGGSEPVRPHGWHAATARSVHVYPSCELPSPGIRFERWTTGPPRQVTDSGDDPEVRARLKFQVTQGSIGLTATAAGSQPGVFALPVGWYHLELLGYRRSVMPAKEKDLYARGVAPGDTEWERAEGVELYVARFWPAPGPAALNPGDDEGEERRRLETIRAWAKEQGIQVNDEGPVPASVIAQYEASHPG